MATELWVGELRCPEYDKHVYCNKTGTKYLYMCVHIAFINKILCVPAHVEVNGVDVR
jgi:hypothetical protein